MTNTGKRKISSSSSSDRRTRKVKEGTSLDDCCCWKEGKTIPFIEPPDGLRCKKNDGKDWRCNRWRIHDKSLCEIHYLSQVNNFNKRKDARKRGREDNEKGEEEVEVIPGKKQRRKLTHGEQFGVKSVNKGKKLGEVDNLKKRKKVTVRPKIEEDEEVVSEEENKKKRDNGSLVKKEKILANKGKKLDGEVDNLKKKKNVALRPKVEEDEEVVSEEEKKKKKDNGSLVKKETELVNKGKKLGGEVDNLKKKKSLTLTPKVEEEEDKKKRDNGSLVKKETMLVENEALEKGKEVELLDRRTRSKEKLKNLIKMEKELDDCVDEVLKDQWSGSGTKRKQHSNVTRNAERDPKQEVRKEVNSCHQCWNSERKVVECRDCKKKGYCSPCIRKW